jgi:hypothetical protein
MGGGKGDAARAHFFLSLWVSHKIDSGALAADEVHFSGTWDQLVALYTAVLWYMDSARLAELAEGA